MNKCTYSDKMFKAYSGMIARFPKFLTVTFVFLSSQCNDPSFSLFWILCLIRKPKKLNTWTFSNLFGQFIAQQLDGVTTFRVLLFAVSLQLDVLYLFFS